MQIVGWWLGQHGKCCVYAKRIFSHSKSSSPWAVWALVGLVPAVNLPVSVQTARVGEFLSTHLAGNRLLAVSSNLTGSERGKQVLVPVRVGLQSYASFSSEYQEKELTYIEHNVSCVRKTKLQHLYIAFDTDTDSFTLNHHVLRTYLIPPIGCLSNLLLILSISITLLGGLVLPWKALSQLRLERFACKK